MRAYRNNNLLLRAKISNGALAGLTFSNYGGGGVYALRLVVAADNCLWWVVEQDVVPSRTFFFRPANKEGRDDSDLDELATSALSCVRDEGKLEEFDTRWRGYIFRKTGEEMPLYLALDEEPFRSHLASV